MEKVEEIEYSDDYLLREQMVFQASAWLRNLKNPEMDVAKSAEAFMSSIRQTLPQNKGEDRYFHTSKDIAVQAVEEAIARMQSPGLPGFATGFPTFDLMFGGWETENIYMFLARPAVGKTSLLNQIGYIGSQHTGVIMFTPEASAKGLSTRLVSGLAGVPYKQLRRGHILPEQLEAIKRKAKEVEEAPFAYYDMPEISTDHMQRQFDRFEKIYKKQCEIVILDYLQQMEGQDSYEKITENMKKLETFCRLQQCAIIMASQVSRSSAVGGDQSAGRGSSKIEDLSSGVFNLDPIYVVDEKGKIDKTKISRDPLDKHRRTITCTKNRPDGDNFQVTLRYDPITSKFQEEGFYE